MDRRRFLMNAGMGGAGVVGLGVLGSIAGKSPEPTKIDQISEWSWDVMRKLHEHVGSDTEKFVDLVIDTVTWIDGKTPIVVIAWENKIGYLDITLDPNPDPDHYVDEMDLMRAADQIVSVWMCERIDKDPVKVDCGWEYYVDHEDHGTTLSVWARVVNCW